MDPSDRRDLEVYAPKIPPVGRNGIFSGVLSGVS
jgi:hypothetical protein